MRRHRSAYAIFFLSGVAGLGYEIAWTRLFAIGLGHEMPSLLAVVAAFFGGLALGAWALDRAVSRSRVPGRWYAALEILIGVWGLASLALVPIVNRLAAEMIGLDPAPWRQWLVSFGAPFITLLPATAAMGATFPAMERLVARLRGAGAVVGGLYAINTLGAVTGTLVTTFVIIPAFGFAPAIITLAVVNFICAAATLLGPAGGESERAPVTHAVTDPPGAARLSVTVFTTGLLGIGFEVLGVRVMAQVLENTVYTFAIALSVYLLGTAAGAALYQRYARKEAFAPGLVRLLQWVTVACLFGTLMLAASGRIYESCRVTLGGGAFGAIAAEALLGMLVFLPPTLVMGATFSHLLQAARGARGGVGRAVGLNTIGSSLASLVFGVLLLPLAGAKAALLLVSLGYLGLLPPRVLKRVRVAPAVAAIVLVALLVPTSLVLVEAPEGMRVVEYREGVMAAVAVIEAPASSAPPGGDAPRLLKVNNRFRMGATLRSFADRRQGHLPLLLHPDPHSALFLGVGTGITAGVAADHRDLDVEAVELLPEVVELLEWFAPANNYDQMEGSYRVADARRFVRASASTYDVIIADLFHPARDGAGALYTVEHFEAIRARLNDGGLFCQWLPLYQMDLETVRLVTRTFLEVFPHARAWMAHFNVETPIVGLVGRAEPVTYRRDWYEHRVAGDNRLVTALAPLALGNTLTVLGCVMADDDDLRVFAGDGPLNTDAHPRVMFQAPFFAYRKGETHYGRLDALLEMWPDRPVPLFTASDDGDADADDPLATRLRRYRAARDLFLKGQILSAQGREIASIDAMLDSVRTSPDFRTAYVTCLQMALTRRGRDPAGARDILRTLRDVSPDDPRAARYLRQLFNE